MENLCSQKLVAVDSLPFLYFSKYQHGLLRLIGYLTRNTHGRYSTILSCFEYEIDY
jgi:hypothetical protein